jgi:hypothetical protein
MVEAHDNKKIALTDFELLDTVGTGNKVLIQDLSVESN